MSLRFPTYLLLLCSLHSKLLLKYSFAQENTGNESCQTPEGMYASCIDLNQCQPIMDILRTLRRPISPEVSQNLRGYKCDGEYKVCCPTKSISHRNIGLLSKDCGNSYQHKITIGNGYNSDINEFPWMALLQYKTPLGLKFLCGGTIINSNYILTAAHCLGLKNDGLVSVRVGEYSLKNSTDCQYDFCNPPLQNLKVEEIIIHPEYNASRSSNDIALLRVSKMTLDDNVQPVCLPVQKDSKDWTKQKVVGTGWGITDSAKRENADILQQVLLPIVDKKNCSAIYSQFNITLSDTHVCAGGSNDGKAHCIGDSGGPLMFPEVINGKFVFVQQAIISFGPRYCGLSVPGVSTAVRPYMNWILDNMKP